MFLFYLIFSYFLLPLPLFISATFDSTNMIVAKRQFTEFALCQTERYAKIKFNKSEIL